MVKKRFALLTCLFLFIVNNIVLANETKSNFPITAYFATKSQVVYPVDVLSKNVGRAINGFHFGWIENLNVPIEVPVGLDKFYVGNIETIESQPNSIAVVDKGLNSIIKTIILGDTSYFASLEGMTASKDGKYLFAVIDTRPDGRNVYYYLLQIDTKTDKIISRNLLGRDIFWVSSMEVSPDNKKLYYVGSNFSTSTIYLGVYDLVNNRPIKNIPISDSIRKFVVSPDGSKIIFGDPGTNTVQWMNANTYEIDKNSFTSSLPFRSLVISPKGDRLYVINGSIVNDKGNVSVVDMQSHQLIKNISLKIDDVALGQAAITPDGNEIYVNIFVGDNPSYIWVINTKDYSAKKIPFPEVQHTAGNFIG